MTEITDLATLEQALWENRQRPHGTAQAVAAEGLLDQAARLGPKAEIKALLHVVNAYEFSADRHKMIVPFAKAVRLWDQDPSLFDAYDTHSLFWMFKWTTTGLIDLPQVSLSAIEGTLTDMDRRYRIAGHTERAVRMSEFHVADHVGDAERARRAFDGWLAAPRRAATWRTATPARRPLRAGTTPGRATTPGRWSTGGRSSAGSRPAPRSRIARSRTRSFPWSGSAAWTTPGPTTCVGTPWSRARRA